MEYYAAIKKNEIMPFAMTWVDLESVVLNEVRQMKTNSISLDVESKNIGIEEPTYRIEIGSKM